jgi:hypothetical protein
MYKAEQQQLDTDERGVTSDAPQPPPPQKNMMRLIYYMTTYISENITQWLV